MSILMTEGTFVFLILMGLLTVMFSGAALYAYFKMEDRDKH